MFYLLLCPKCKSLHAYEHISAKQRIRKKCVYCRCTFEITKKRILKAFETPKECREAHKILSQHLNDHSREDNLNKIITHFRKLLVEGLKTQQTNLETEKGYGASPPNHLTISDLSRYGLEVDRVHFTALFSPALFHALNPVTLDSHKIDLSYGTIIVYSSGITDFSIDLSDSIHLAQLEGILANFLKLSGLNSVTLKIHDHEFTINIPYKSILADKIIKTFGDNTKAAFIEQSVKIYDRSGTGWRIEAQTVNDAINVLNQVWAEKLGPSGINVLAWNSPVDEQQLQVFEHKLDSIHDQHQIHNQQQSINDTVAHQALNELIYSVQDVRKENELLREESRERDQRIESALTDLFQKKPTTKFMQKCNLIVQKLTEKDITLDELAIIFKQKKQGLLRYLSKLIEDKIIESYSVKTGKRGRPKNKYHLLGGDKR